MPPISSTISTLFSDIQSSFNRRDANRRDAVRYRVTSICGHSLQVCFLKEPTKCSQCSQVIWSLIGKQCELCKLSYHNKNECLQLIASQCTKSSIAAQLACQSHEVHNFERNTFLTPTFCDHCKTLLIGVYKQGLKCSKCAFAAHSNCKELVSSKCVGEQRPDAPARNVAYNHQSRMSIEDFDLLGRLGTGSFSKVYLAKLRTTGERFAIKAIDKTNLTVSGDPESALAEMRTLHLGRNFPFLSIANCCFQSKERLYLVMEHVDGNHLFHHLCMQKLTQTQARFYAAEIALALIYLHKKGVVHRDLKAENVFIDSTGHCKLIDFGMCKELDKTVSKRTKTFCGTPFYIAPEIIKGLEYDFSPDWWSFGVLIHEMLVGVLPFDKPDDDKPNNEELDDEELYRLIVETDVDWEIVDMFCSELARNLLEGLLTKEPQYRLGCGATREQAILEHPFFLVEPHFWDKILRKQIEVPRLKTREDSEPEDYLARDYQLTPVDESQLELVPQGEFAGFSFYSDSITCSNLIT